MIRSHTGVLTQNTKSQPSPLNSPREQNSPFRVPKVLLLLAFSWVALPGFLFLLSGTWQWWQAAAYCTIILLPMTAFTFWAQKRSPELLARRMETKEDLPEQAHIMKIVALLSLILYVVPAIEYRWTQGAMWFHLPDSLMAAGLGAVLVSYLGILQVMISNPWAGRTVRTWNGHKLVTDGPYSKVRHPMYSAFVLFLLGTPFALGSVVALIPAVLILPLLIARIRSEEAFMLSAFPEYAAYQSGVHYRLVPGVW